MYNKTVTETWYYSYLNRLKTVIAVGLSGARIRSASQCRAGANTRNNCCADAVSNLNQC